MPTLAPFTPAGVQEKQDDLYALSDAALAVEAAALKSDFYGWMIANFQLSDAERAYISTMNTVFTAYLSDRLSFSMIYRLSIVLTQQPFQTGYSKILDSEDKTQTKLTGTGLEVTGSFQVDIIYQPL